MTASFFVFGWKMSLKNEFILVKNKISKRRGKDIPFFVKYRPLHNKSLLWNTSHKDTTCEHVWLDANIDKEGTAAAALAGELPCMKTLPVRTCGIPRICQGGGGGCCCCCSSSCSSKTAMGTSCELPGMRTLPLSKSDWIPSICQGGGCCCCYSSCCNKLPWVPGVNYLAWERRLWACVAAYQGSAREVATAALAAAATTCHGYLVWITWHVRLHAKDLPGRWLLLLQQLLQQSCHGYRGCGQGRYQARRVSTHNGSAQNKINYVGCLPVHSGHTKNACSWVKVFSWKIIVLKCNYKYIVPRPCPPPPLGREGRRGKEELIELVGFTHQSKSIQWPPGVLPCMYKCFLVCIPPQKKKK